MVERLKIKVQGLLLDRVTETTKELGRGSYGVVIELKIDGTEKCAGKKLHDSLIKVIIDLRFIIGL